MYRISKEFHFSASHILHGLEDGHPCGRLHGHNYVIIAELSGVELDETGFVEDYGELKDVKKFLDGEWDHRHLNDVMDVNPTAENMARVLFERFKKNHPKLSAVGVKETPKTIAWYHGE